MIQIGPFSVKHVSVTLNGVTHHGTYYLQGSRVHVQCPYGQKATQIGGSPPEAIAKLLLGELVRTTKHED
jgi:hypothetical protein